MLLVNLWAKVRRCNHRDGSVPTLHTAAYQLGDYHLLPAVKAAGLSGEHKNRRGQHRRSPRWPLLLSVTPIEYLRPKVKALLTSKDEGDLFNIVNNFGVRHPNELQKTSYDAVWLNWMFYFYLATVHTLLRKIGRDASGLTMPQKRSK